MADDLSNANGQPAWTDPVSAAGPTPDPSQTVAPTPSGQMPPQPPQGGAAPQPQAGQQAQPQSGQQQPQGAQGQPQADQQAQPQGGQQQPQVQNPSWNKNSADADITVQQQQPQDKFGWLRNAAETLTGGPRYTTSYDENGNVTRTRVQPSLGHLGMAIALEALSGGLAAASAKGPNAIGQGAAAGLQQGQQIAQQNTEAEQRQQEQAEQDQKIKQQAVANNMNFQQNTMLLGRMKMENAQAGVEADKSRVAFFDKPENESRILLNEGTADDVYKTLAQHPGAQVLRLAVHPRVDAQGKSVFQNMHGQPVDENTPGAYQAPDFSYRVVDPTPITGIVDDNGNITDSKMKEAQDLGIQNWKGTDGTMPKSFSIPLETYNAAGAQVDSVNFAGTSINQARETQGLDPVDFKDTIKNDKTLIPYLNQFFGGVLHGTPDKNGNPSDHPYQDSLNAIANSSDSGASAAGKLTKLLGDPAKLDAQIAKQHAITNLQNHGIGDDKDANLALSSGDKTLQQQGKQYFDQKQARIDADEKYKANVQLGSQESLAKFKSKLANDNFAPDPDTGAPNATIVAAYHRMLSGDDPDTILRGMGANANQFKNAFEGYLDKIGSPLSLGVLKSQYKDSNDATNRNTLYSGRNLFGSEGEEGSIDKLENDLAAVKNGKYPWINKGWQELQYHTGDPVIANLLTDFADVSQESSTFMAGSAGRNTDMKLRLALDQIRQMDNPDQQKSGFGSIRQLGVDRFRMFGPNVYIQRKMEDINHPQYGKPMREVGLHVDQSAGPMNTPSKLTAPQQTAQVFDPNAWIRANPGQEANIPAVTAQARKQGMQIKGDLMRGPQSQ